MEIIERLVTPVTDECDVLVCGGGFAGVAAALAARRQGRRVILIERNYILGGLGTAGLITIYLPLCDGMGHQVSFGLAEELLRLSISPVCEDEYPDQWLDNRNATERDRTGQRFRTVFNAGMCAIMLEKQLMKEGVEILYGTCAVKTEVENNRITAVIVENKNGRSAIKAVSVVDATGDADLGKFSEVPCENFKQGNLLASWYYAYCREKGYHCNALGVCDIPDEEKLEGKSVKLLSRERFTGLDAKEISRFVFMSHDVLYRDVMKKREEDDSYVPATMPTIPELRMTRKVAGEYTLDTSEQHTYFEDSVGMVADWRKRGPVFEVPFGTLYSGICRNLIFAGRCVSVTESMWDIMRVIPCCAVTGQAAGTAAAISGDFPSLDVAVLQKRLSEAGVVLHENIR